MSVRTNRQLPQPMQKNAILFTAYGRGVSARSCFLVGVPAFAAILFGLFYNSASDRADLVFGTVMLTAFFTFLFVMLYSIEHGLGESDSEARRQLLAGAGQVVISRRLARKIENTATTGAWNVSFDDLTKQYMLGELPFPEAQLSLPLYAAAA